MTEDDFWEIVETTRRESDKAGGGTEKHTELLTAHLAKLPVEEIGEFQGWFEYFINRAYTPKVFAAHLLVTDMAGSDDGFLYFRTWLVGQGELLYKSTVKDPDSLADQLHPAIHPIDQTGGEVLRYAATFACEAKTGLRDGDVGWPLDYDVIDTFVAAQLAGERPIADRGEWLDKADIPKHLPRLTAKCEKWYSKDPRRPQNMVLERQPDGMMVARYRPRGKT